MGKGVQALLDIAFPPDEEQHSSTEDDEDKTQTQYDNDGEYREKLETGPPPTLFPAPASLPPPTIQALSPIKLIPSIVPPPTTGAVPTSAMGPVTLPETGPVSPPIMGPVSPPTTGLVSSQATGPEQ